MSLRGRFAALPDEATSENVKDCLIATNVPCSNDELFMKWISNLLIPLFILTSCTKTPVLPTLFPTFTVVPIQASSASISTATESIPESTPQLTATITPCDPQIEDFCITDGHFIFQRPIRLPANNSVDPTYPYGSTAKWTRDPHHGVEFQSPFGTPVYVAAGGIVIFAGSDEEAIYSPWTNFYGNLVVIEHNGDLFTLYAHLSKINIQEGQTVRTGDKIGEVGQSGAATGSHLHFEIRRGDVENYFSTVNPELWLLPAKDENGAISISVVDQNGHFLFTELTVNYYLDRSQPAVKSYYLTTYTRDLFIGDENAAISDLDPGIYRIALTMNGQVYERWVEVESGKLTQVVFIVR